jgi:hypothetical protein
MLRAKIIFKTNSLSVYQTFVGPMKVTNKS